MYLVFEEETYNIFIGLIALFTGQTNFIGSLSQEKKRYCLHSNRKQY